MTPRPLANAAVMGLGYAAAVGLLLWWGGFRGYDRSPTLVLGTLLGTLLLAVVAQVVAHAGSDRRALLGLAVGAPIALFAWKFGYSALFDDATRWWPTKPGFRCMRLSLVDGGAVLAASLLTLRGARSPDPRATGAAVGAAAGSVAWLLVDLWCPVGHPMHLFIGHVVPMVALTAVGALAAGRIVTSDSVGGTR